MEEVIINKMVLIFGKLYNKAHLNRARSRSVIGIGHDSVVNVNKSGFQVMDFKWKC